MDSQNIVVPTDRNPEDIKSLNCNGRQISRISGLQYCTNLRKLSLSSNRLVVLSGLSYLKHLTHLELSDNSIISLEGLKNQSHLTYLDVSNNSLTDLIPLKFNTNLRYIDSSCNNINIISDLSDLCNLQILNLEHNIIKTLDGCSEKLPASLEVLMLAHNHIAHTNDIEHLEHLVHLKTLTLKNNPCINNLMSHKMNGFTSLVNGEIDISTDLSLSVTPPHGPQLHSDHPERAAQSSPFGSNHLLDSQSVYLPLDYSPELPTWSQQSVQLDSPHPNDHLSINRPSVFNDDVTQQSCESTNESIAVNTLIPATDHATTGGLSFSSTPLKETPRGRNSEESDVMRVTKDNHQNVASDNVAVEDDRPDCGRGTTLSSYNIPPHSLSQTTHPQWESSRIFVAASSNIPVRISRSSHSHRSTASENYLPCVGNSLEHKSATQIQSSWRGYWARTHNPRVISIRSEIRTCRLEDHILFLKAEMEQYKAQYNEEKRLRRMQLEALWYLWHEVECLQQKVVINGNLSSTKIPVVVSDCRSSGESNKTITDVPNGRSSIEGNTFPLMHQNNEWSRHKFVSSSSHCEDSQTPPMPHVNGDDGHIKNTFVPQTPLNLRVTQMDSASFNLTWDASGGSELPSTQILGYRVYVNDQPWGVVDQNCCSIVIGDSNLGQHVYKCFVRTVTSQSESDNSNVIFISFGGDNNTNSDECERRPARDRESTSQSDSVDSDVLNSTFDLTSANDKTAHFFNRPIIDNDFPQNTNLGGTLILDKISTSYNPVTPSGEVICSDFQTSPASRSDKISVTSLSGTEPNKNTSALDDSNVQIFTHSSLERTNYVPVCDSCVNSTNDVIVSQESNKYSKNLSCISSDDVSTSQIDGQSCRNVPVIDGRRRFTFSNYGRNTREVGQGSDKQRITVADFLNSVGNSKHSDHSEPKANKFISKEHRHSSDHSSDLTKSSLTTSQSEMSQSFVHNKPPSPQLSPTERLRRKSDINSGISPASRAVHYSSKCEGSLVSKIIGKLQRLSKFQQDISQRRTSKPSSQSNLSAGYSTDHSPVHSRRISEGDSNTDDTCDNDEDLNVHSDSGMRVGSRRTLRRSASFTLSDVSQDAGPNHSPVIKDGLKVKSIPSTGVRRHGSFKGILPSKQDKKQENLPKISDSASSSSVRRILPRPAPLPTESYGQPVFGARSRSPSPSAVYQPILSATQFHRLKSSPPNEST